MRKRWRYHPDPDEGSRMAPPPTVSLSRQSPNTACCAPLLPAGDSRPQPADETSVARAGDGKQLKNSVQCGAYPSFRFSSSVLSDRQLLYVILISTLERKRHKLANCSRHNINLKLPNLMKQRIRPSAAGLLRCRPATREEPIEQHATGSQLSACLCFLTEFS